MVVNGSCVFESIGLEICENAVRTLWILDNLYNAIFHSYQNPRIKSWLLFTPRSTRQVILVHQIHEHFL